MGGPGSVSSSAGLGAPVGMSNLWDVIKICASCNDRPEMIIMLPPKVVSTGQDPPAPFPLKSIPLLYVIEIHICTFMMDPKISKDVGMVIST